jgi:hypothetical protein
VLEPVLGLEMGLAQGLERELGLVLGLEPGLGQVPVLEQVPHKRQLNTPSLTALACLTISSSLIYLLMECYSQPFTYYCESHHPLHYRFLIL